VTNFASSLFISSFASVGVVPALKGLRYIIDDNDPREATDEDAIFVTAVLMRSLDGPPYNLALSVVMNGGVDLSIPY